MRFLRYIPYELIIAVILGLLFTLVANGQQVSERLGKNWWRDVNSHGLDPALVAMQSDAFGWKLPVVNAQTVVAQRLPATEYVFAIVASFLIGFIAGAWGNERLGVKPFGTITSHVTTKEQNEQQQETARRGFDHPRRCGPRSRHG